MALIKGSRYQPSDDDSEQGRKNKEEAARRGGVIKNKSLKSQILSEAAQASQKQSRRRKIYRMRETMVDDELGTEQAGEPRPASDSGFLRTSFVIKGQKTGSAPRDMVMVPSTEDQA
ncbi:MAG: hypothetical protein ACLFQV_05710, partial [Vulcanimicrobiota bacterium]